MHHLPLYNRESSLSPFPIGGIYDQASKSMILPNGLGSLDCETTKLNLTVPPPHQSGCTRDITCCCPGGWLRYRRSTLIQRLYATIAVPCGHGCPCPDRRFCSDHNSHHYHYEAQTNSTMHSHALEW